MIGQSWDAPGTGVGYPSELLILRYYSSKCKHPIKGLLRRPQSLFCGYGSA